MLIAGGLLFAVTVAQPAALRSSCDRSDPVVTTVPAGTSVDIRFAVSDGSNCFKIAATIDGKPVLGYVDGAALSETNSFDNQRKAGTSLDGGRSSFAAPAPKLPPTTPRNAKALVDAAVASYQGDDLRSALNSCRDALGLTDDAGVAGFCKKIERELSGDKSGDKLFGMRVALRYEGEELPADVARSMLAVLDEEFIRISDQLGCRAEERIVAIVQSPESYRRTTNAAEWSAGLFDGRIHVPLMDGARFGPQTRRTFAHETVHACLANLGRFPSWLHEGLAQKLSGDTLPAGARQELNAAIKAGTIPKLERMGQDWSHLSTGNARLAYNLALAAADILVDNYASIGLRNILRNPSLLEQTTSGIDKALGL